MANDSFALSPIAARATQPSEEDYDAISEAFMETARGRWFLGEYAKRNRNADTRMVLDVVERLEQSLAAQRIPEPEPIPDTSLADALIAIKAAVDEARDAASGAVDDLALSQRLAPIRKGTRVIREISWRWREIGADSRICDLIDSQVSAIEASCAQISLADPHPGLQAAFALIDRAVAAFDENKEAEPEALAEASDEAAGAETAWSASDAEAVASADEPPAETTLSAETVSAEAVSAEAEQQQPVSEVDAVNDAPVVARGSIAEAIAIAIAATTPEITEPEISEPEISEPEITDEAAAEVAPETADAQDEALLDMVAAEMGAPDLSDDSEIYDAALAETETAEMEAAEPAPAEAQLESPALAPRAATPLPTLQPYSQPSLPQPLAEPAPEPSLAPALSPAASSAPVPAPEPSLGSTLIASGLVSQPKAAPDPLAALRRLSQVEKIALFS